MYHQYTVTKADYDALKGYAEAGSYIEYYNKLAALGDRYATLALGVAEANSIEGNLARKYAENAASWQSGTTVSLSGDQWLDISRDLMEADWRLRERQGELTSETPAIWSEQRWQDIRDYHIDVFAPKGLPRDAWTGTIPLETNEANADAVWDNLLSSNAPTRLFREFLITLDLTGATIDTSIPEIAYLISTAQYAKLLSILFLDVATDLVNPTDATARPVLWLRSMLAQPSMQLRQGKLTPEVLQEAFGAGALFSALGGGAELRLGSADRGDGGRIIGGTRGDDVIGKEGEHAATEKGDIIVAYDGDDTIYTKGGDDQAYGLAGNDVFIADRGNDLYDGGGDYSALYNLFGLKSDFDTVDYSGVERAVEIDFAPYAKGELKNRILSVTDDGFGDKDVLRDIEKVILSKHTETLNINDAALDAPIWIDMGEAGGATFGKTDYDKLSFRSLSEGVVLVNGVTQNGPSNGPMTGGIESLKMLASLLFNVPPSVDAVLGGATSNNALRVTGAEDITLTGHDDVLWFDKFSLSASLLTGWPEGSDYPTYGDIHGGAGHDIVYVKGADYVGVGEKVGEAPAAGEEDKRPTASQELRLVVHGDEGEDRLIAQGGEGAILYGGAGQDFLYNSSWKGQLYGGDGVAENDGAADVFWWSAGSFIMDAGTEDILQFFGLPLTGGYGVQTKGEEWAYDWVLPFIRYGLTDSKQLIVQSWIGNIVDHVLRNSPNDDILKSSMIVEDYDQGEGGNWAHFTPGDLGMTFRIMRPGEQTSGLIALAAFYGFLSNYADAVGRFGKELRWIPGNDPLILDLNGDGITTTSLTQSGVHFDFNGDSFAERSGWVGADDGFLALDRDGNGRIDDISELFGRPDGSGFAELRLLDDNADGKIDASDVVFSRLQVWRDLNQDGVSKAGELFTLSELGIVSINDVGAALNVTAPSGALLRERATFSYADGTTGAVFEAIFESSALDTVYNGDRGVANWVARDAAGVAFDSKGYGLLADLAVTLSNDAALNETIAGVVASMTTPDLVTLRNQVAPVLGGWAAALAGTRELTPVRVQTLASGATLLDRAIWVDDAQGGFFQLESGAQLHDPQGAVIARPQLMDFYGRGAEADGSQWKIQELFSPSDRSAPVESRSPAVYLVTVVDGRAVVRDFGIEMMDAQGSYWRLASGADVRDASGNLVARPSLADLRLYDQGAGETWRVESFGYNEFKTLPFDKVAVYYIDGKAAQYSVYVEDAQGGFYVWSENLDRALALQYRQGRPSTFNLRDYEIDLDNLSEANAVDGSAYRAEVMTVGEFRYAAALNGIEFRPEVLHAAYNTTTGFLEYQTGGADGFPVNADETGYASVVTPTLGLIDALMKEYLPVSRAVAVRLAAQGGLAEFFVGIDYDAARDKFTPTGNRELTPMLQKILEAAPTGEAAQIAWLNKWNDILSVLCADYAPAAEENLSTEGIFQELVAAYENAQADGHPPALTLSKVASLLGVDPDRIITHNQGATLVSGTSGGDIIYASVGDQTYEGGVGADTYVLGRSFGRDIIRDVESFGQIASDDTLRFAQIASNQVSAYKDGLDLVIEVLGTSDVVTIKNQFLGPVYSLFGGNLADDTSMTKIVFADGIVWNALDIAIATSHPKSTNDLVMGTEVMDVLDGGAGNDILRGGRGADIYVYKIGDGSDVVDEQSDEIIAGPRGPSVDVVAFGDGVTQDNIRLTRIAQSKDLNIDFLDANGEPTDDHLEVKGQFDATNIMFLGVQWFNRIERFVFSDNGFLSEADIMQQVLANAKTAGDDAIFGFTANDQLDGGAGADLLAGGDLDDTYIFGVDYGNDVIQDQQQDFLSSSYDTLEFVGLASNDFDVIRVGDSATIMFRVRASGEVLTLRNEFKLTSTILFGDFYFDSIDEFHFADGAVWDMDTLARHLLDQQRTDGDDTIYGFDRSDVLDGGAGDDLLKGGVYSDTYVFREGYGHDKIYDISTDPFLAAGYDRLEMQGLDFNEVTIGRFKNDLIFTLKATGESITLTEQYNRDNGQGNAIEQLVFADQTILYTDLNPEDVDLIGTNSAETLYGTDFGETIDARGGDDSIVGGSGGDTYKFDIGYGQDAIFDRQAKAAWDGDDTIAFGADVTRDNIRFTADGVDLVISFVGHTDTLRVQQQFGASNMGVERLKFSDGVVWTIDNVRQLLSMSGGTLGDDQLHGMAGHENVLDGRQGNDNLYGAELSDTYAFSGSYDSDTIYEAMDSISSGEDKIVFGELITPDNLVVRRDGDDLVFSIAGTTDELRIVNGLTTQKVEKYLFASGVIWTLDDARALFLKSTDGDDALVGFDGNDALDGGLGSDDLQGGLGDDTYTFDIGYGADAIADVGGAADKIVFGSLIAPSMLELHADGANLVIRFKGHDDSLAILDGLGDPAHRIETLFFADGTSIGFDDIRQRFLQQLETSRDDIVIGYADRNDTLTGGAGDDLLTGLAGNDAYEYRAGDGFDIIDDQGGSGSDRLSFVDYRSSDSVVRRATPTSSDLLIEFPGFDDSVLIKSGLIAGAASAIEQVAFVDGVTWSIADLQRQALAQSGTGDNDYIVGFSTADALEGKAGNDVLDGGGGSDSYLFTRGDGKDAVNETGTSTTEIDVLKIRGYTPTQVRVIRPFDDRNDLQLLFEGTDDLVTLKNQVPATGGQGVERIEFGDGTVWLRSELSARLTQGGGPAGEEILGTNGADTLIGRGGNDTLRGAIGNDLYIFNRGDGHDLIEDSRWNDATDVLDVRGYVSTEARLSREGNNLILHFADATDEIILKDSLYAGDTTGVDQVKFQDGVIWDRPALRQMVIAAASTSGSDTIVGSVGSDMLVGGLGDDYLSGDTGNDLYIFNRGDGHEFIEDGRWNDAGDVLDVRGYVSTEARLSRNGNNVILRFVGATDEIVLKDSLYAGDTTGVDQVKFQDGVTWNRATLQAMTPAMQAIYGAGQADTLSGGVGDQRIEGGAGNDAYVFNRGDGHDVLVEGNWDIDTVLLHGYTPSEVILGRQGDDVILRFTSSDDSVTLKTSLTNTNGLGIDRIAFDDNTVWTMSYVRRVVIEQAYTGGQDTIYGVGQAETLRGGLGDDVLTGYSGNDTYVFNRGDGHDVLVEGNWDIDTVLLHGYTPSEVILGRQGDDVILRFTSSDDSVTLKTSLTNTNGLGIDRIAFDDTTVWTMADVRRLVIEKGYTSDPDIIIGTANAERITGSLGDDRLSGAGGDDTYVFVKGDGHDIIQDKGANANDKLEISGYRLAETSFLRIDPMSNDLLVSFNDGMDTILVANGLAASSADAIEHFDFVDDATTLSLSDIQARMLTGVASDGADYLMGTSAADALAGGRGADYLDGGAGDDSYYYNAGDGDDMIADSGATLNDTLRITGYLPTDIISLTRNPPNGVDLILTFRTAGDILLLKEALGSAAQGIESIVFDGGVQWSRADLYAKVLASAGTSGDENIWGFDGADTLQGRGGADWLSGGLGGDTYLFAKGDGVDTIKDNGSDNGVDQLVFTTYRSTEASVTHFYKGDDGVLLSFAGNPDDQVIILNTLTGAAQDTIESISFVDGVTWSMADVLDMLDNNAPVARADGLLSVVRGKSLAISAKSLLRNDYDADNNPISIVAVKSGIHGSVVLDANGDVVFTADETFSGATTFDYTISDGHGGQSTATVQMRIRPPASASDDSGFTVAEDGFLNIRSAQLLANDFDGDLLTISQVLGAQNGAVSLSSDGDIAFTPGADFNGVASFSYVANTADGGRAEASVSVVVTAANDAPIARGNSGFAVNENGALTIGPEQILANDSDVDGDPLTIVSVASGNRSTATLNDDGSITVTPDAYFFGATSFAYSVSDGKGGVSSATVTIDVAAVDTAPEVFADQLVMSEDTPLYFSGAQLLANDVEHEGQPMTISRVFGSSTIAPILYANGDIYLIPATNYNGSGSFSYEAADGAGGYAIGNVAVTIDPVNDAPNAVNDVYAQNYLHTLEDTPLILNPASLLANDFDIDSPSISLVTVSFATKGSVALLEDGMIQFTPDANFYGPATFRYVIADTNQAIDDAMVKIYVDPTHDAPPVAVNDSVAGYEDVDLTIPVSVLLANDYDVDGTPLQLLSVHSDSDNVRISDDGLSVIFRGAPNAIRHRGFDYTITDGRNGDAMGAVDVFLNPINDAPVAAPDTATTSLGVPLVVRIADLLANDSDVDVAPDEYGSILRFLSAENASFGALSIYNNEFVVIDQGGAYSGPLLFEYTLADDQNATTVGLVSANVTTALADVISGSAQRDLLIGSELAETINGGDGNDDIFGRGGDDYIFGGPGADNIDGGEGYDTVSYAGSNIGVRIDIQSRLGQVGEAEGDILSNAEAVEGTALADQLYGDAGANRLAGGGGLDVLVGRGGGDTLLGGLGDDTLTGGAGADVLDGGAGADTADYSESADAVTISLQDGAGGGGDATGDTLASIENVIGTIEADSLEGNVNANWLSGGRSDDALRGLAGDDTLVGGKGADALDGGDGFDIADYSESSEAVSIDMSGGTLGGGDAQGDSFLGVEAVYGSYHDDMITGDAGDNIIRGGAGADTIVGGGGLDIADYGDSAAGVTVNLSTGVGAGDFAEGDHLTGVSGLIGSSYADTLFGDAGANRFQGGDGDDTLQGAAGSDEYVFGFDSRNDTIIEAGDEIDADRLVLDASVTPQNVSLVRQGVDLLIELEHDDGFIIDAVKIRDHFLGASSGIEEIVFADGLTWTRSDIEQLYRNDRFNAVNDLVRWGLEDTPYAIDPTLLLENDTETPDPLVEIVSVQSAVNGAVQLQADGTIIFTGAQDFYGDATFDYTATDGRGRFSTATAQVILKPVNDAPVAQDDGYNTGGSVAAFTGVEDTPLLIPFSAILANDSDVDGDPLYIVGAGPLLDQNGAPLYATASGTNGHAIVTGDGVLFIPSQDYFGMAGFRYTVSDGLGGSSSAQIELHFVGVNDAPLPTNDRIVVYNDQPMYILQSSLISNDFDAEGDALSFLGASNAINGDLALVERYDADLHALVQTVRFTPTTGFFGLASFEYLVGDPSGLQATGHVVIEVKDNAPTARDDFGFTTVANHQLIIDPSQLLVNDSDVDHDPITLTDLDLYPSNGEVAFNADGMIVFTPHANYNGPASFDYWISDGRGETGRATVHIDIAPENSPPIVRDDVIEGVENSPNFISAIEVFANDGDPEGDVIFFHSFQVMGALVNDFASRSLETRDLGVSDFAVSANSAIAVTLADGTALPSWLTFDATSWMLHGTAPADFTGLLNIRAAASMGDVATHDVVTITRDFGIAIEAGAQVSLQLTAEDFILSGTASATARLANGEPLPDWLHFDAQTWTLSGLPPEQYVGRLHVVIQANDPASAVGGRYAFDLVVDPTIELASGVLNTDYSARPYYTHALSASELSAPAEAALSAKLADGSPLPEWLNFDAATRTFSGQAPNAFIGNVVVDITSDGVDAVSGANIHTVTRVDLAVDQLTFTGGAGVSLSGADLRLFTDPTFSGAIAILYNAEDMKGATSEESAIVVVNILPAPVAVADQYATLKNSPLSLHVSDLLANDFDKVDAFHLVSVTGPSHGSIELVVTPQHFDPPEGAAEGLAATGRTFSATRADGSALPNWLSIDAVTGMIAATPPLDFTGSLDLIILATDGETTVTSAQTIAPSVEATYRVVYTPNAGYSGEDQFTYKIADSQRVSEPAIVSIDVRPTNIPPVAKADNVYGFEDTVIQFTVASLLANDLDADGLPLDFVGFGMPTHGSLTLDGDTFTYTPDHNFDGVDTLQYTISDGVNEDGVGVVNLHVASTNHAPVTGGDRFAGFEDQPVIVSIADLLGNDFDPDGDAITFVGLAETTDYGGLTYEEASAKAFSVFAAHGGGLITDQLLADMIALYMQPIAHGSASLLPDGRISFTGPANYSGDVAFAYEITDGRLIGGVVEAINHHGWLPVNEPRPVYAGGGASGNIIIHFSAVNDAPVAHADRFTVAEEGSLAVSAAELLGNDTDIEGDPLTLIGVDAAVNGLASLQNGVVTFSPRAGYFGNAGFEYTIADAHGATSKSFVAVDVTPVNHLPFAVPDSGLSTFEDTPLVIDPATLLANDYDADGDTLNLVGVSGATLRNDGMIVYAPPTDAIGASGFTYQISDGVGPAVTGMVSVDVTPVNDVPILIAPIAALTVAEDAPWSFTVPAGTFLDVDGDALTYSATHASGAVLPSWLTFDAQQRKFTGLPPANFNGAINLSVVATDGTVSAHSDFTLTVTPVNDAPVAQNDAGFAAVAGAPLTIAASALLANDNDVDGDAVTVAAVSGAQNGSVALTADGIVFTAAAGYAGPASFVYTASDGKGGAADATVSLSVSNPETVINGPAYGGGVIQGYPGFQTINAYGWNNTIYANGGSGTINAGSGNATVDAGTGSPTVNLAGYYNVVSGGDGNASVSGSAGDTTVTLGNGSNVISTGGYNNSVTLGNGVNTVDLGAGNGRLTLGGGANVITIAGYGNIVTAGDGANTLTGGAGNGTFTFGSGNNSISTSGYTNRVTVGNGDNHITAGSGAVIAAGNGDNIITLAGYNNVVTLGSGINSVGGGLGGDNVTVGGGSTTMNFSGWTNLATIDDGEAFIFDHGGGLGVKVGAAADHVVISGFDAAMGEWVDLLSPAMGYSTTGEIVSALQSNGAGGAKLTIARGGVIEILGVAPNQLTASNFRIG